MKIKTIVWMIIFSILAIILPIVFCSTSHGCFNLGFNNPLYLLVFLFPLGFMFLIFSLTFLIKEKFEKIGKFIFLIAFVILILLLFFWSLPLRGGCHYRYDWQPYYKCPSSSAFVLVITSFILLFLGYRESKKEIKFQQKESNKMDFILKWIYIILMILLVILFLFAWMLSNMDLNLF